MGLFDFFWKPIERKVLTNANELDLRIEAARREGGRGGSKYSDMIVNEGISLRNQDLEDWKRAMNQARAGDSPSRISLYNVFDSLRFDAHVESCIDSRILPVLRSKYMIYNSKSGDEMPELAELFKKTWFKNWIKHAMMSRFIGAVVIEMFDMEDGELTAVTRIPERHVDIKKKIIKKNQGDETGWSYEKPPIDLYYMQVGDDDDLGILATIAPWVIAKKFAVGSWSDFVEKFGVPPRWVTANTNDKKRLDQLSTMMRNMISSAWAVLQGDEKIESLQVPGTDAWRTFDQLISRMNSEVSKRILGQDGTTDNKDASGTYGSLKVLQDVAEDRHEADKDFIKDLINTELFPRLIRMGYKLDGAYFDWDDFNGLPIEKIVDAVSKLSPYYEIDIPYIEEKTGIKILKQKPLPGAIQNPSPEKDDEKKKPIKAQINALYESCHDHDHSDVVALDDTVIRNIILSIAQKIFKGVIKKGQIEPSLHMAISSIITEGTIGALDVNLDNIEYDAPQNQLIAGMRQNIIAFALAKSLLEMREMIDLLVDSDNKVKSFSAFKRDVLEVHQTYNVNWLQSEYNHAVATGQMAEQWLAYEEEAEEMPYLTFSTVGDDRVRDSHAALNGITRPVNDAFWDRNYPPLDWGCRCDTVQTNDRAKVTNKKQAEGRAAQTPVQPYFATNPGKTREIFAPGHPYFNEAGDLSRLKAVENYGMKDIKSIYADPGKLPAGRTQTFDDYWKRNEQLDLKDRNGNVIRFERGVFKQSDRAVNTSDVLTKPSEIWSDNKQTTYVKYYNSEAIVVRTNKELKATKFEVINPGDEKLEELRKGILMHR